MCQTVLRRLLKVNFLAIISYEWSIQCLNPLRNCDSAKAFTFTKSQVAIHGQSQARIFYISCLYGQLDNLGLNAVDGSPMISVRILLLFQSFKFLVSPLTQQQPP